MMITPYVRSNTLYLDFHDLNYPFNEAECQECVRLRREERLMSLYDMPMFLHAEKIGSEIWVIANFQTKVIQGIPRRYHYVARNDGKTPCSCTVIFHYNENEFFIVNQKFLRKIVLKTYKREWLRENSSTVKNRAIEVEQKPFDFKMHSLGIKFEKITDINKLLYCFNQLLFKNKTKRIFDETMVLSENPYDIIENA